jgi:hypothetical protein
VPLSNAPQVAVLYSPAPRFEAVVLNRARLWSDLGR